jgi:RNA 2',3'-cyclic 3'-phosphodiesterase
VRERLFVAVGVPPAVCGTVEAAIADLRVAHPQLRWVSPEGWHLTLAFLGWVGADRAEMAGAAVGEASAGVGPFELSLDGRLDAFGGRVLWAAVAAPGEAETLAERVRASLAARDLPVDERPFRPHLTVARAPRGQRVPTALRGPLRGLAGSWRVDEVVVMRSHLGREGARYERRFAAALAG